MAPRITLDLLNEKGACREQRTLFAKLFPDGTEVTRQLCIRYAEEFDFDWAAKHLLPMQAWQEYLHTQDEAWEEYERIWNEAGVECDRIRDEAWAEYERIQDEADEKHRRIQDEAWAKCLRIRKEAWAKCRRIRKEVRLEYLRIRATEFARLWNKYMSD